MKNKYIYRSHISERKTRLLIQCFALDLTAAQASQFSGVNPNTAERVFSKIRIRIFEKTTAESPAKGEFEADESYFGARRVKGKRGRGASGKTIVFGLYKRGGKVYTEIVPDVKSKTLQALIRGRADIESVIHTDGWVAYDGLVDLGYEKHYRVQHGKDEFSKCNGQHINGIESFWGYAKHRLTKFKGIPKNMFELHLKETEFRFNHRGQNLYHILLKELRNFPLK
jgi:transposase-like protein